MGFSIFAIPKRLPTLIIHHFPQSIPTLWQNKSVGYCKKVWGKVWDKVIFAPFIPKASSVFMKKRLVCIGAALFLLFMSGCAAPAENSISLSTAYAVIAVLSLLLLIGYCCLVHKKNTWLLLLFTSVLIVNAGYFTLSVSKTLEEALLANRISYLGSVFLPLSMLMIILDTASIRIGKWLPAVLLCVSIGVFFVAASPGYLDIYYKEVSIQHINGITVLNKVYGPWHKLYFYYLFCYFAAMIAIVAHAIIKRKVPSGTHSVILAFAVLVNIGVWLMEQLIRMDFEMLSVSYIISELFLLGLYMMLQEEDSRAAKADIPPSNAPAPESPETSLPIQPVSEQCLRFAQGLQELTPTERAVYDLYLQGKTTREIMNTLNIKENTLKFHNKNLYGKLGVSSRKQLLEAARTIDK